MILYFFALLIAQMLSVNGESIAYYVEPADSSTTCKEYKVCHTLQEYASKSELYFQNLTKSVVSLIFMNGSHVSNSTVNISYISELHISCHDDGCGVSIESDFIFKNISLFYMNDIDINGKTMIRNIETLVIENVKFHSFGGNNDKNTSKLAIDGTCSHITVTKSIFIGSTINITLHNCSYKENYLIIQNSAIRGEDGTHHKPLPSLGLLMITITTTFVNISECHFTRSRYSGFHVILRKDNTLNIIDSSVQQNRMSGIYILITDAENHIHLQNTTISNNSLPDVSSGNPYTWQVPNAAGLSVAPNDNPLSTYKIIMDSVIFEGNHDANAVPKTVFIYRSQNASISNSRFADNHGTAISIYLSKTFILSGKVEFNNNYGYEGGGLLMFTVFLTIADDANITFRDNQVENVGGAICIRNIPIQIDNGQRCFYQFQSPKPKATIVFYNNTAKKGGWHIYGATTKTPCNAGTEQASMSKLPMKFDPDFNESVTCVTSDPTRACLCEGNKPKCADENYIFYNKSVHPGESFNLSVIVVGADFGAVAGSVFATTNEQSYLTSLESAQNIATPECQNMTYTIHSRNEKVELILSIDGSELNTWYKNKSITSKYVEEYKTKGVIDVNLLTTPLYIGLTMQKCPSGFSLNEDSICDCHPKLKERVSSINCCFKNGKAFIERDRSIWLAPTNSSDYESRMLLNINCRKNKCIEGVVDLNNPDVQCKENRTGKVCGQCKKGHSLALGSSNCLKCDCLRCNNNLNLLLILVFLAAGFILVFFMKLLDLTVANGLLHGLIFYCNVLWINGNVLIPFYQNGTEFPRIFLAWFNLNFGIETCFFNGLDAYVFTWLQFLFPVYIWCISITLIFIAKRVNILGNNGVPVLLTLFLLSYSKILITIVSALSYTVIYEIAPNTIPYTRWAQDGNLGYLEGKHIPLFIVALLALIFIVIPYTFFLLFSRHLYKITHPRVSRWVNKLKPVIDAHSGPFKDKKEYWIGVLLLVRILFTVTPLFYGPQIKIKHFSLVLILSGLLLYKSFTGPIYKKKYLSLMENSLIYNAIVLSCIFILPNYLHYPLTYVLVGIAFCHFLVVVTVQAVVRVRWIVKEKCYNSSFSQSELTGYHEDINDSGLFHERSYSLSSKSELTGYHKDTNDSGFFHKRTKN